jgi:hypothetical protein
MLARLASLRSKWGSTESRPTKMDHLSKLNESRTADRAVRRSKLFGRGSSRLCASQDQQAFKTHPTGGD